ncbi:MAG: hypothetical protein M1347_08355 [Chloroflexi bacterium]|nr:hypothetical protein [Chloroflexota bacterium]
MAVSPAAQPVSEAVADCAPINEEVRLSIEMQYPNIVDLDEFDLFVGLAEPDPEAGFAAQLAWEQLVLIVNLENDVDISRDIASALFSGRVQNWSELGGDDVTVSLWAGPESDEARQAFEANMLRGSVSGETRVATNPETALEAVANDPGAAAILPAAWADERVRLIDLGVQVPVVAVASEEPTGPIRDLVACLQGPTGQESLSNRYTPFQQ